MASPLIPKWMMNSIPGLLTPPDRLEAYFERAIDPLSPRRRWHVVDAAERAWFFYGDQWIRKVQSLAPGNGTYNFDRVTKKSAAAFKLPVLNLIKPAVMNDVARLSKKEYVPETSASKNKPKWIAAASAARDILMSEAEDQLWAQKREQVIFNLVLDGTAIVRTFRDEIMTDCSPIAALNAVHCPSCDMKLASNQIPHSFLSTGFPVPAQERMQPISENAVEFPSVAEIPTGMRIHTVRLRACPLCGQELQPYDVSREEAADGTDSIGNPLGEMLPNGDNAIEVVSMHDFYPENGGVRREPHECRVWHQQTVRDLEWVVQRFPEIEDELEPENPLDLLRLDPLYGSAAFHAKSPYGKSGGIDAYQNAARVREIIVAPQKLPGLELGAWFVKVGDGRILSRPLCQEVDGENGPELVPRCKYHIGRYARVPGQFWGTTFIHDLLPINRRVNEIDAQGMDLRERGKPLLLVPEGFEMNLRDDMPGSLQIAEYEDDNPNFDPHNAMLNGMAMTANPYHQERAQCLEDAKIVGAPQDIEVGASVGGIKTTSGLMLVSEQAGEKRGPVERGLIGVYEGVFQHLFDMSKTFQVQGGKYVRRNESGFYEVESWQTEDLLGTQKVKVTARAGFDNALYVKEATGEAQQMGLYDLSSPVARDRALENMKMPKINDSVGVQIKRAEMAWGEFIKDGRIPVIDETLYDPVTWFELLGKYWLDDEAMELQRQVEFDGFFARLAGWREEFAKAEQTDLLQRQVYENMPREQWQPVYSQVRIAYERALQAAKSLGATPEQMPQPPPAPPQGDFLPKPLDLKILTVWKRMLGPQFGDGLFALESASQAGIEPTPEAAALTITMTLLSMRAVIEAFGMLVARKQASLMPPPAAPGAPAPPAGPGPA